MAHFWRFSTHLLHERTALVCALVFAFFSASGLGAGLLVAEPLLSIILGERSLVDYANEFNAQGNSVAIPQALIDHLPTGRFESVALLIGIIAALTILGGIANFLHQYLSQTVTTRAVARIRAEAFEHVVFMPLSRVMSRGASEFVARIIRDAAELQRGMIALVSRAVTSLFKGVAALIVAVIIDWRLTLIAVPTAILMGVVLRKLGKRIRRGTRGSLKAQEGLLRLSTEVLQGLRAVKANTAEGEAIERFRAMNEEAVQQELKVRTARAASSPVVESLATFVVLVLVLLAAREILTGSMQLDRVMLALGALAVSGATLRPLAGLINEIQAASAPAHRLADLMDEPREAVRSHHHGEGDDESVDEKSVASISKPKRAAIRHVKSIEFDNISFTYPGAERPALSNISLNILHGERVAIVGPNGCGKTTLLSMVPRLLTPTAGRICIDGVDIASFDLFELRRQIGVVTQETVLFRGTIASNIAFGLGDVSRTQIIDAAKRAHADSFINRIPGGYDADVLEQGASLSGGQRQRLSIARAILRDPTILILDEATSQIDAESEAEINKALAEFCRNRTALVIAHRLSTVLSADRIVVMDEGRIIDQGRHEQLYDRCELYRRLSRTQLLTAEH